MDNYSVYIKYGTDKKYFKINNTQATGPMTQVLAYLSINMDAIMLLSDNGKIKVKIKPVR